VVAEKASPEAPHNSSRFHNQKTLGCFLGTFYHLQLELLIYTPLLDKVNI
jgi:hypothetical protein